MNTTLKFKTSLLVLTVLIGDASSEAQVKLAQTGMQFLSIVSDARVGALGKSATSVPLGSASLFFNPAAMADGSSAFDVTASLNQWIADIKHETFSLSVKPWGGDYGVLGASIQTVNYGEIIGTIIDNSTPLSYVDIGNINASGIAIGLGYAKSLSNKFLVGGQVRWVKQSFDYVRIDTSSSNNTMLQNALKPLVFDFGTLYKTGFKSLAFGMSIRNFATQQKYESESFILPLTFTMGASMDLMDFSMDRIMVHSLLLTVDAVHNRDYREQVLVGLELDLLDVVSLRGGYVTRSDEDGPTYGVGFHRYGVNFDYAYAPFGVFNNVQRFTIRYSM